MFSNNNGIDLEKNKIYRKNTFLDIKQSMNQRRNHKDNF